MVPPSNCQAPSKIPQATEAQITPLQFLSTPHQKGIPKSSSTLLASISLFFPLCIFLSTSQILTTDFQGPTNQGDQYNDLAHLTPRKTPVKYNPELPQYFVDPPLSLLVSTLYCYAFCMSRNFQLTHLYRRSKQ